ncbi:MAG TPA: cytochrome bc complex cytochrome b subunit [Acidimicrobiia bacterium]
MIRRLNRWVDERIGSSRFTRESLNKVFPDHWSFMLGEIALYAFVVLILTGIYLTFFFDPSLHDVRYHGSYAPLRGTTMSEAYRSVVHLSLDVRAGLVMRQIHHWAALLFLAAIVTHLCRIFFTGAFRKPRELNWIVGATLLVLGLANGFTGYSLPDDLLSGTGLRVAYSFILSIPFIGEWTAFLVFGGEFPSDDILRRLFVIHILLVPLAILGLLSVHLAVLWRQKHAQFPGRGREEHNVVGSRLWPSYAMKSVGLFALVAAVLAFMGGLVQINPVWLYGPYKPAAVSTAAQPDWYLGWVEGAIRLFPPWSLHVLGGTVSEVFWPSIALPAVTFLALYAWPFVEAKVTGDHDEHHLLDRPSDRPVRTAIGIGALTFYGVLMLAGGQDIIAQQLSVGIKPVTFALRAIVVGLPVLTGFATWRICREIRASGAVARQEADTEPPVALYETDLEGEPPPHPPPPDRPDQQPTAAPARRGARRWLARIGELLIVAVTVVVGRVLGRRRTGV